MMWAFYLFFKNAYMNNLHSVGVWGKQVLFLKMTLLGSLLLQRSEAPEPKIKQDENDTVIGIVTKYFRLLQNLEMIYCLFYLSLSHSGQKHFIKDRTNELCNVVGIQPSRSSSSQHLVVPCSLTMSSSSIHIYRCLLAYGIY